MNKLKKMRLLSDLKQIELCKMLEISQSYLSLLENNHVEPNEKVKQKIKEVFNVSVNFID